MPPLPGGKTRRTLQALGDTVFAARPLLVQRLRQGQVPLRVGALAISQHGLLRKLRQPAGQHQRGFARHALGYDPVAQAHLQGFGGFHFAPGQDQVHGMAHALSLIHI